MNFKYNQNDIIVSMQKFIGFDSEILKYLHNTREEEIAERIVKQGFKFEKYLENSTDLISGVNIVELNYFKHTRRSYGLYTMIIQISKDIANKYADMLAGTQHHFTEVIIEEIPELTEDNELIYTLPNQFVKGYFNLDNGESKYNENFNPYYDCANFAKNVLQLLQEEL